VREIDPADRRIGAMLPAEHWFPSGRCTVGVPGGDAGVARYVREQAPKLSVEFSQ
jgi:hypothetical protein